MTERESYPEYAPTVAQWARAEAFKAAATWLGGVRDTDGRLLQIVALQWAKIIETGEAVNP